MSFTAVFSKPNKRLDLYLFAFFSVLTFALYYSSLNNFYVLDDFTKLKAVSEGALSENFHFFPLPLLIYRILYLLFGVTPVPLRIFNYFLNALMCVVVFRFSFTFLDIFLKDINEKKRLHISFFASLLFCVHYIHVETIVYYSELHEMLYSIFYLSGLYFYLLYRSGSATRNLIYAFLFYILCILSKESAVTFMACIFLSELFIYRSSIKSILIKYYPLLLITFGFTTVRYFFFPSLDVFYLPESFISVISEAIKNYIFSFTAFVVSLDFIFIKDVYRVNGGNLIATFYDLIARYPQAIAGIAGSILLYILIFKKPNKLKYLLILFALITISSFAWLAGYERYLYLPSAAFWILFINFIFNINLQGRYKKIILSLILLFVSGYNVYSLVQKEANWIKASEISQSTINNIVDLTKGLPAGSRVYFKDLPGDYKGAWVLRYGIHLVPELFLKRKDLTFNYFYDYKPENNLQQNVYVYEYMEKKIKILKATK